MNQDASALSLEGIDKAFDGVAALSGARLDLRWGEVHGLLGENGAGKSTLMNIVCGLYSADSGSLSLSGQAASIDGPVAATARGIGMVHQHFKLVGPFTVAENVLLACAKRLSAATLEAAVAALEEAARSLGFSVDPQARVDRLSIAEQQRVEILKLVILGADILILDEPTSVLTDDEAASVLRLLRQMADSGKAVVLITHRLQEVLEHADRITVMRGGETVLEGGTARELDAERLAQLMVGARISEAKAPRQEDSGEARARLQVEALTVRAKSGRTPVEEVTFDLRAGEILGIAGVGGNGQTELAEALYGLQPVAGGRLLIDGEEMTGLPVPARRRQGLRLVPADRYAYALLPNLRAQDNLAITGIPEGRFGSVWWLDHGAIFRAAQAAFESNQILGGQPDTRVRLLSGGNAQKLLLARELSEETAVLVAHSPTRGLDVRACQAVHSTIVASVEAGAACLLISEDLDEVMQLSNRVAVMSRGRLEGPFEMSEIDRTQIGALMAGHA